MSDDLSRRSNEEIDDEIRRLEAVCAIFFDSLADWGELPGEVAAASSEGIAAASRQSRSYRLRGLRMAVNDVVVMARELPPSKLHVLNERLEHAGAPTLSSLMRGSRAQVDDILRRGRIRNEEEHYLMKEELNDLAGRLTEAERDLAARIVADFENRHV